jgi:tetratricopeptide (TPR) repeat protein
VQSVVAARLGKLSDEARAVAEVAAAIGRDFSFDLVAQVSDLEEDAVVRAVDELWRRQIVRVQPGERWDFGHDRIREVAYATIGPARLRLVHRRIAQALERTFAADLDPASAAIATHLERGGQPMRAIPFLERAAAVAVRMSAHEDAIRWLTEALRVLEQAPAGRDRDDRELSLRTSMSGSLTWARGYAAPVVEENIQRAIALCRALGRDETPPRWLWGLWTVHYMQGDLLSARDVSERAVHGSAGDPSSRCEAHHAMGCTLMSLGELEASREHFEASLAAYDERAPQLSALGSDLGVFAHAWHAHTLWLLGDAEAAVAHADEAVALARRHDHVYSETLALAYATLTHQMRRDPASVAACAHAVVARCDQYAFAYYGDWARVLLGWARGQEGRPLEGVAMIEEAIARLDAQRAQARRPYYWSLLAETLTATGQLGRAASILDSAIATALARRDAWWLPELYRQKSELEAPAARAATLTRALEAALRQGSRWLEARIRASLATI